MDSLLYLFVVEVNVKTRRVLVEPIDDMVAENLFLLGDSVTPRSEHLVVGVYESRQEALEAAKAFEIKFSRTLALSR